MGSHVCVTCLSLCVNRCASVWEDGAVGACFACAFACWHVSLVRVRLRVTARARMCVRERSERM